MITVSKSTLKSHMLELFRRVEEQGEDMIVTSHRKPVIRVSRLAPHGNVADIFSDVRGKARLPEDEVMAPESWEWDAAK